MEFQDAVQKVLEIEGGDRVVDHPKDPGGLTKFGISLRAHPELGRDGIINLTEDQAVEIYRKEYWQPLKIGQFTPSLTLPLFDAAVNHGPKTAVELLQRSLNKLGADLKVDGVLGVKTIFSVRAYRPSRVLVAFLAERLAFYRSLETYSVFGFGWDKRILEIAISV